MPISCGAQPSGGVACAIKRPFVFAQWTTGIWACYWCTCWVQPCNITWSIAFGLPTVTFDLVFFFDLCFNGCGLAAPGFKHALQVLGENLQSISHGCQDSLNREWRWNCGRPWLGLDLAFSRGIWPPQGSRCHWTISCEA